MLFHEVYGAWHSWQYAIVFNDINFKCQEQVMYSQIKHNISKDIKKHISHVEVQNALLF